MFLRWQCWADGFGLLFHILLVALMVGMLYQLRIRYKLVRIHIEAGLPGLIDADFELLLVAASALTPVCRVKS